MTEQKWLEICDLIKPHLEAVRKIAEENNIRMLNISTLSEYHSFNCFMTEDGMSYNLSDFDGRTYINYQPMGGS